MPPDGFLERQSVGINRASHNASQRCVRLVGGESAIGGSDFVKKQVIEFCFGRFMYWSYHGIGIRL